MDRHELLVSELRKYNYETASNDENGTHIAENYTTPYPMIDAFYEIGDGNYPENSQGFFTPPEQGEYAIKMYKKCKRYAEGEHESRFNDRFNDAWIERFKRAWSSFVRDVHFAYLCESSNVFERQVYNTEQDKNKQSDLTGWYDGTEYHISLFVDTHNGRSNLERKLQSKDLKAVDITVPLKPSGIKNEIQTNGDSLWLYSKSHINALKDILATDSKSIQLDDGVTVIDIRR